MRLEVLIFITGVCWRNRDLTRWYLSNIQEDINPGVSINKKIQIDKTNMDNHARIYG